MDERRAFAWTLAHFWGEPGESTTARFLRGVHRGIGVTDQVLNSANTSSWNARTYDQSDRGTRLSFLAVFKSNRLAQSIDDSLGDLFDLGLARDVFENDHELVAADPRDSIA